MRANCIVWLVASVFVAACASKGGSGREFHSRVLERAPGAEKDAKGWRAKVGHRFVMHFEPWIGWAASGPTGLNIVESHVKDAEYAYWGDLPPGLRFDPKGVLEGIPTQRGSWAFKPAVRDKKGLHESYRGEGYWGTTSRNAGGTVWAVSQWDVVIIVE